MTYLFYNIKVNQSSAIKKIEKSGILLVFPIHNKKEPDSLWAQFHPRKKMIWKWDDDGDNKVGKMWMLMKRLSDSRKVVYSKWYQGRATFFSRTVFTAMMRILNEKMNTTELSKTEKLIYETLEMDSPLSTKQLKILTELQGKFNEPVYTKALKTLFSRLLIVAYGEVADGAFPSLALGATKNLYEELWQDAQDLSLEEATEILNAYLPLGSSFRKFFDKIKN